MEKESREKQIYRVTIVGSIANFFLLVFKFVAGILGQSSDGYYRTGFCESFC